MRHRRNARVRFRVTWADGSQLFRAPIDADGFAAEIVAAGFAATVTMEVR